MGSIIHAYPISQTDSLTPRRKPPARLRRVNRAHENDPELVAAAVPVGCMRAAHGDQVMARLLAILSEHRMRADGHRARVAVLTCLIARADYETMTTRPGWEALAEAAKCTTRSVARTLAQLEAWGLLGRVAGGRQAQYAAAGPDGERINEAAVYVLCVPSPLTLVHTTTDESGDINVTPPALGGSHLNKKKLTHTRTRENPPSDAAPPQLTQPAAANGGLEHLTPYRPEIRWNRHRTTRTPIQRLAAATELRHQIGVLRPMSPKDIRSVFKDFFEAGWTIADLHHALDWQPAGTRWPHSGAPDVTRLCRRDAATRMRGWLKHRLNTWRTSSGEPLYSRTQREEAAHRERKALQAIERRRILEEQATRAARAQQGDSPAKIAALAQIRAALR